MPLGASIPQRMNKERVTFPLPLSLALLCFSMPPLMSQPDPYLQTQINDQFLIEEKIGEGGMGVVYSARHLISNEQVAIKILRIEEAKKSPGALERFRREAEVLQSLRHPGIVSYVASGITFKNDPFLAMEFLSGQQLLAKMKQGPLSVAESIEIGRQVCEALAYVHANGVLHRDIKPANLFLLSKENTLTVKLIDFGIARFVDQKQRLTKSGNIVGTPAYMAPEQIRGDKQSDDRADIYSLGVTLYEMLSGQMPLDAPETLSLLLKILEAPPRPIREFVAVPGGVEAILMRSMSKDPLDRYQSAAEMAKALRALQAVATPTPPAVRAYPSPIKKTTRQLPENLEETQQENRPDEEPIGELRRVIVVVAVGSLEDAASLDKTEVRMREAGGLVERLYDGRVVGFFGASYSHGDEPKRAILSALESSRAGLCVGIASGRVLSSKTLFSDAAIPEAAALVTRARPGDLLLSQETFASTRGLFDVEPAGGGAWRVIGERPDGFLIGTRGLLGVETPTVGRDVELSQLRSLLASLPSIESPQAVLILGDAGMGKSRMKFELRVLLEEGNHHCYIVEGTGDPVRSQSPYFLFRSVIRNLCGAKSSDTNFSQRHKLGALLRSLELTNLLELELLLGVALELLPEENVPLTLRQNPKILKSRTEEAFVSLFIALSHRAPVVFILEDLHWSDGATMAVVERMLAEPTLRLFLFGLGRPVVREQHPNFLARATCIALRPLAKSSIRVLVEAFLHRNTGDELIDFLWDATAGNPFLIESLLMQLVQQGFLMPSIDGGFVVTRSLSTLEIPEGAEALIQSRLDSLPNEEKEVLKKAAVFGKVFWDYALTALKVPDVERILERLRIKEFVVKRTNSRFVGCREYIFRHSLLQEVSYRLLPSQERRVLHAKAANWLVQAGEKDTFALAKHFETAQEKERAGQLYAAAARRAVQEYTTDSALMAIQKVKQLGGEQSLLFEMLLVEESLYFWSGEREKERKVLDELIELSLRLGEREKIQVMQRDGRYAESIGEYARSEERSRAAMSIAQQLGDTEQELSAVSTLCGNLLHTGRYAEVQTLAERGVRLAKMMSRPDLEAGLQLRLQLSCARRGMIGQAYHHAQTALQSARQAQERYTEATALASLGALSISLGDYQEAESSLLASVALANQIKSPVALATSQMNIGRLFAMQGRFDESLVALDEASSLAQRIEHPGLPDRVQCYRAHTYLLRGLPQDFMLAQEVASQVLSAVQRKQSPTSEKQLAALAYSYRAFAHLRMQKFREAEQDIEAAFLIRKGVGALEVGEEELLYYRAIILRAVHKEEAFDNAINEANELVRQRAAQLSNPECYLKSQTPHHITELYALLQGDVSPTIQES
jgi:serine/threonine protein kinase/predicted ATPase